MGQMKAHAIMFHHLHDGKKHIKCQGSISADDLRLMLDYYGREHNIISASDFRDKALNDSLDEKDVCLAFDDGLLCQYEVAYPVLKERGLNAFWFIYTSPQEGKLEKLEVYHHFRFSQFDDIEDYYGAFFSMVDKHLGGVEINSKYAFSYKSEQKYYTPNDRKYRYIRDKILSAEEYDGILTSMMQEKGYRPAENASVLWIDEGQIRRLKNDGNLIGLHSHTHPTILGEWSREKQRREYQRNQDILSSITGSPIDSAAYPCQSYNADTLAVMHELNIRIGFRADMYTDSLLGDPKLELPREDHSNIMKEALSHENYSIYG